MNLDITFAFVYYTTNYCIGGYNWRGGALGIWYDTKIETYFQACDRVKDMVWDKIYTDWPHLKGQEIDFTESYSSEMPIPVIQERDR